ncbi:hypothetical protein [Pararhodonellum marinum]|uniref:hypothetical protein n=1 Tax=Pararhodonellum marinum TaxID=2755358 RepID=UPI001890509E|nr:hypothetical protein [Pararhodonellum marinum]
MKKINCFFIYSILSITFLIFSCSNTTTPDEYLNDFKILDDETYAHDISIMANSIMDFYDSIRLVTVAKGGKKSKTVEIIVDTVFYGPDNKVVFLALRKVENIFVINNDQKKPFEITYSGECYIGIKNGSNNKISDLRKLKYSVTSRSYEDAKRRLETMYLKEMKDIEDMYNINDKRIWNILVWENLLYYCKEEQ